MRRALVVFRPTHEHTIASATVLLGIAIVMSRCLGYAREAYIAYAFGAQWQTDAYIAAFTIPDILYSLMAGGTMTVTLTSVLARLDSLGSTGESQKAFSLMTTVLPALFLGLMLIAELIAPFIARLMFPQFTAPQLQLCIRIIRILLPARFLLYMGMITCAALMSRRLFFLQGITPLLENISILSAGFFAGSQIGITALAIGWLVGAFAVAAVGCLSTRRAGLALRLSSDTSSVGFREWIRTALPMMASISMFTADNWFLWFFASGMTGDITRLHYAKQLLFVPIALIGSTISQAAVPFLSKLFAEHRLKEFEAAISAATSRVSSVTLLSASWLASVALPFCDLLLGRGHFHFADSQRTALYLSCLAFSLVFWSVLIIYSRAFCAARDTLTPAITGTVTALLSFPIYGLAFRIFSTVGLAIASDIAAAANCIALVTLMHRKGFARVSALPWAELKKILAIAVAAFVVAHFAAGALKGTDLFGTEEAQIAIISAVWLTAVVAGLWLTGSDLMLWAKKHMTNLIQPKASAEHEAIP
ncbi:MAG TPA: lipid II flippase MurJ [Terriglobales bacterium]|nr:lipid II flippase MurJ [Terriglobales bacterium]